MEVAELDPPATRVDEAAFVAKGLADRLLDRLAGLGCSCTQVQVEAETEHGEHLVRSWRHEGALTAAALAARVRWQLEGWIGASAGVGAGAASGGDRYAGGSRPTSERDHGDEAFVTSGLTLIRLTPEQVVPADGRQLGFWGGDAAARDRADRALARLQGLLGHDAVVTAVPGGGRTPAERVRWVTWGDARDEPADSGAVWPGAVPARPRPGSTTRGWPRRCSIPPAARSRSRVGARPPTTRPGWPARCCPAGGGPVRGWAGPWVHDVRWWDRRSRRRRGPVARGGRRRRRRRGRLPGRDRGWSSRGGGRVRLIAGGTGGARGPAPRPAWSGSGVGLFLVAVRHEAVQDEDVDQQHREGRRPLWVNSQKKAPTAPTVATMMPTQRAHWTRQNTHSPARATIAPITT